jgi:DNA-binding CsgD family transcriptional regulator
VPQSRRLIGRGDELDRLLAVLDAAAQGQAGGALVGGDAGVGKTRLITELIDRARDRDCMVLVGQCVELGESMPYLPLAEALWGATRDPATAPAVRDALRDRPVLARLLPDSASASPAGDGELVRQQLFGAVLGLLGELADAQPVLLVLEDLHWADHSTRDLLVFLSRMLQRERVCVVGTYRTDDLHRRHPLRPVLAELFRLPSITQVELAPLTPEAMADHLTELAGERLAPEVLDRLIERAGGNAFYAEELLAAAATGEELPAALADLLLARLERLSDTAQRVVRVAAVAGARVDDDVVREVSGLDSAAYDQALREIVSHQLLVPDGAGYTFRHALLREAVYADLLPGERTRLHAAFADLLRARGDRSAAELAHHSLASHDIPGAFVASMAAGGEAERLGAPAEAHEHFDQVLSLWDAVPDAEALAGIDRVHLSLRTAAAAAQSGQGRLAVSRLRRLHGLLDPAADATVYAEVGERLAHYTIEATDHIDAATELIGAVVDIVPAEPPTRLRAAVLATYTRTLLWHAGHTDIPRWADEAIAAARATGSTEAEISTLATLGLYHESIGENTRAEELFDVARNLARRTGDLSNGLRATYQYTRAQFDRGDLAAAAASIGDGVRLAVDSGLAWSPYGVDLRFLEYLIHFTMGDWDRAEALTDSFAIRVGTLPEAVISAYALFIEVARGTETVDERLSWLEPLWSDDSFVAYVARGLAAEHALWQGDEDTAIEHITAVMKALEPGDASAIRIAAVGLWAHANQAERARAGGDESRAQAAIRAADDLVERARWSTANTQFGRPRAWLGPEGRAWAARAEAEWQRARGSDDPKLWRAVVDAFDYGYPYEVARAHWRLAEVLAARGEREEAQAEWRQALDVADRLDAAPLRRALHELGRHARFGVSERADTGPLSALTSREREVLRLVADGRNNREIAATLFISPKTASVHVSNILTKLGVSSRTQAAAIAHRSGLLAETG